MLLISIDERFSNKQFLRTKYTIENIYVLFRPIAGNVNVCPKRLRGDRNSIDFDRLVSTIKHEILHTLVR